MTLGVRGVDTASGSSNTSATPSVTVPAAAQAGDYALLFISFNRLSSLTPPAGWSLYAESDTNTSDYAYIFEKVLTAGDLGAALVVNSDLAGTSTATVVVYQDSNKAIDQISFATESANNTTVTIPAITPVAADCLRGYFVSDQGNTAGVAVGVDPPTGYTEDADNSSTGGATNRIGHAVGHKTANLVGQAGVAQGSVATTTTGGVTTHEVTISFTIAPLQGITVNAEVAAGSGAAQNPTANVQPSPAAAAGTGDALDPATATAVLAGAATGTGDAPFDTTGQSVDLQLVADNPILGLGAAYDAVLVLLVAAEPALGSGAAIDATVPSGPTLAVAAEAAAGAGAALDATVILLIPSVPALYRWDSPTRTFLQRPFGWDVPAGPVVERVVGLTVLRVGGVWRAAESTSAEEEAAADRLFYGGHYYVLDAASAAELVAAGFGAYLTQIQ